MREKAFEKLTSYTNHWKAYIYKGEFADSDLWLLNVWSDVDIDALTYSIPNQSGNESPRITAELKRKAKRQIEVGYENYPFGYFVLETKIRWKDLKGRWIPENNLSFKVNQLIKDQIK